MLRFTKESDWERIERLKRSIINDYVEDDEAEELFVSEADLVFLLEKADKQIKREAGLNSEPTTQNNNNDIPPIEPSMFNDDGNQVF